MKHLKKFSAETAFKQDDIDHIRDIVISWADDFDFDIIESNDDSPGIFSDSQGIYCRYECGIKY